MATIKKMDKENCNQIIEEGSEKEIWKQIEGYNYAISNWGRIKRGLYGSVPLFLGENGYYRVYLWKNDSKTCKYIHELVIKTFIGERPENKVIDHINRVRTDNSLSNLRYITHKENMNNRKDSRHL
jgi:hypothetical protein